MELGEPFKKDKDGLYYIDSKDVEIEKFDFQEIVRPYAKQRDFYHIKGISDYVIKDTSDSPEGFNTYRNKKLLKNCMKKRDSIPEVDFPVAYFKEEDKIKQIVPYYEDAISLRKLTSLYQFEELTNYYQHCDDENKNLVSLCLDVLNIIEKLYNQDVVYTDIGGGNFVIYNNSIKIVDFDPRFVHFTKFKKSYYELLLFHYTVLVDAIWRKFGFKDIRHHTGLDFEDQKCLVKEFVYKKRG